MIFAQCDVPSRARRADRVTQGPPFDLRALRYVLAAAEHLSFRRAADALETRASSVSRGVRDFEDRIGVALFERGSFGVRLTDAGARFLDQTIPAIQQIETAVRMAGAAGRVETGAVRIGIITSLAGGFLRDLLQDYSRQHPDVAIVVHDGGRRDHVAALRARQLDVAFVTGSGPVADCETVELWRERVHVALPAGHRLAAHERLDWPDLRGEHFIVTRFEPGPEVHDYIVRRVADYSTYPCVEHKPCNQDTLMNLVALGQGLTLVSAAWGQVKVPDLALRPLTAAEDVVPFSAVWSPDNDNPALRRFISEAYMLAGLSRHGKGRAVRTQVRGNGADGQTPGLSP